MRLTVIGNPAEDIQSMADSVNALWEEEHNVDGGHSNVTADSLTLQQATVGTIHNLEWDAARFFTGSASVWTVEVGDWRYFRFTRIGQMIAFQFYISGTTITVDTASDLIIRLPEWHAMAHPYTGAVSTDQLAGTVEWQDVTNSRAGIGNIYIRAESFAGFAPSTVLSMSRFASNAGVADNFYEYSLSNDLSLRGHGFFFTEPNNIAVPFFGA